MSPEDGKEISPEASWDCPLPSLTSDSRDTGIRSCVPHWCHLLCVQKLYRHQLATRRPTRRCLWRNRDSQSGTRAEPSSSAMGRVGLTAEAPGGKEWAERESLGRWSKHTGEAQQDSSSRPGRACDLCTESKLYSRPRRSH